ncbi:cyclin-like protein [Vararia minispora EC-137]|uniref:Cyclin-like protein n=1 Tax=Vararia minispora EC-137 TaxID=1314806 RepID=A0ACB8QYS9_9AGAM|nr:cyclin-like protein [Vararia minispora EC-137]
MATDFWSSSHHKRWIVDRATLKQARSDDLQYVENTEQLDFLNIYFGNLIVKLGQRLQIRQRVIATAAVFFRRFYIKNSYCDTDPFIVIAACCYVAAKAEEQPIHIKAVVSEARQLFGQEEYGGKHFPSDNSKLAEMEFYLVGDLECDLTVFHPYRTLTTLCGKEPGHAMPGAEAGEVVGVGVDDGPRYWGTGEGKLVLEEGALQMAWFIINDTYRSELCLLYPPHLIAIAALYLTLILHPKTRAAVQGAGSSTRRSARQSRPPQDFVEWLAGLRVSHTLVTTVVQEIVSLYSLWDRFREDAPGEGDSGSARGVFARGASAGTKRTRETGSSIEDGVVTPASLSRLLFDMRRMRMEDLAHPPSGRPLAVNKMLERTQASG